MFKLFLTSRNQGKTARQNRRIEKKVREHNRFLQSVETDLKEQIENSKLEHLIKGGENFKYKELRVDFIENQLEDIVREASYSNGDALEECSEIAIFLENLKQSGLSLHEKDAKAKVCLILTENKNRRRRYFAYDEKGLESIHNLIWEANNPKLVERGHRPPVLHFEGAPVK